MLKKLLAVLLVLVLALAAPSSATFSQWTNFGVGGSLTGPAIAGSLSLRTNNNNMGGVGWGVSGYGLATGAGTAQGKIRTLVKMTARSTGQWGRIGLFCMMQGSIAKTSNAYTFTIDVPTNGTSPATTGFIWKGTPTDNWSGINNLTASFPLGFNMAVGDVRAIELEWNYSAGAGTALFARAGQATDFSDLALVASYVDNSSPYTSGVSAGVFTQNNDSGSASGMVALWDTTTIIVP